MPSEPTQIQVAIGSRIENVELVQIAVEASLDQLDLDDETAHFIGIAVREAVANAIKHGNAEDPEKTVEVDFAVHAGEVTVRVSDQGEGFDPEELPDPRSPTNLLRPNGRGIFFMQRFMDEIDYTFRPEGGTVVTLRKRVEALTPKSKEEEED